MNLRCFQTKTLSKECKCFLPTALGSICFCRPRTLMMAEIIPSLQQFILFCFWELKVQRCSANQIWSSLDWMSGSQQSNMRADWTFLIMWFLFSQNSSSTTYRKFSKQITMIYYPRENLHWTSSLYLSLSLTKLRTPFSKAMDGCPKLFKASTNFP